MATENEPAKLLLPFLQRADELQKHEPLVSYYCRLYAMERGLKIPQKERTKTTNALLVSLMNQLEKDKKSLTLGPEDHLHVEGFALNVFSKADKQDRAGRADLNTAKTFYAASIFFEILNQFGPVQPDLEQKQKYAAWKAADIRKAMKEGRKPVPGPPGGEEDDLSFLSRGSSGEYDRETTGGESAARLDHPSRVNPSSTMPQDSEFSPQQYHNMHSSSSFSSQPSNVMPPPSNLPPPHHYNNDSPPDNYHQQPSNLSTPPDNYHQQPSSLSTPPDNYHQQPSNLSTPPDNYYQPPPNIPEHHSVYPQSYNQPYQSEHQQHNPSQNIPPYSYPNFQSYPSFTESSLPTVPSHYPSYYQGQGVDGSYTNLPPANTATYPSSKAQYDSSVAQNGNVPEASQVTVQKYEYDSNYEPPPAQIAEAQKAARFAVGALAFDDVFVAVDHLKKALELLTKPSAGH